LSHSVNTVYSYLQFLNSDLGRQTAIHVFK
jgi:hypothetical protein